MRIKDANLVDLPVILAVVGINNVTVLAIFNDPAIRAGFNRSQGGVVVIHPFGEGGFQRLVSGIGVVVNGGTVLGKAGLIEHPVLLRIGKAGEGSAGLRNLHIAPANGAVVVI